MTKRKDVLIGDKYGILSVIKRGENAKRGNKRWICKCECGNITVRWDCDLKRGKALSCGCLRKKVFKYLTKRVFGKLTVISYYGKDATNHSLWNCECECGGTIIVRSRQLQDGITKSCGCLKESWLAFNLKKYCKNKYGAIIEFSDFKSPKSGYPLPFDIYLPKEKIFIEIQGEQHYRFSPYYHKTIERFNESKKRDRMKRKYARKNGFYFEINQTKIKNDLEKGKFLIDSFVENKALQLSRSYK